MAQKRQILLRELMQTLKQPLLLPLLLQDGVFELKLALEALSLEQYVRLQLK